MSKTEGHAGKTAKKNTKTAADVSEQDKMRVERWRGHVDKIVTNHDARGVDIPSAWFEEIEGRPMVDVITDYICRTRGVGVANPPLCVKMNHEDDCDFETYNTRTRNAHEREVAYCAVMFHLDYHNHRFTEDTMHELIRRFYRKGDCGIVNAVSRAVESALAWERDADANADIPALDICVYRGNGRIKP